MEARAACDAKGRKDERICVEMAGGDSGLIGGGVCRYRDLISYLITAHCPKRHAVGHRKFQQQNSPALLKTPSMTRKLASPCFPSPGPPP